MTTRSALQDSVVSALKQYGCIGSRVSSGPDACLLKGTIVDIVPNKSTNYPAFYYMIKMKDKRKDKSVIMNHTCFYAKALRRYPKAKCPVPRDPLERAHHGIRLVKYNNVGLNRLMPTSVFLLEPLHVEKWLRTLRSV